MYLKMHRRRKKHKRRLRYERAHERALCVHARGQVPVNEDTEVSSPVECPAVVPPSHLSRSPGRRLVHWAMGRRPLWRANGGTT